MNHRCKEMVRDETLKTPLGQAAWLYYQDWMTGQKKVVARLESFLESRFFNSFLKFAQWAKEVGLPDANLFIKLMIQKQISPMIWTTDEIYSVFIEYFDLKIDPMEHARIATDTILELCATYKCDPSQLFDKVDCSEVITNLRQRRLSPWILLNSQTFKRFYVNRTNDGQRVVLETLIRPDHWAKQFKSSPDVQTTMKSICAELKI